MIQGHEKLRLIDTENHDTGVVVEVNWSPEDTKTNECKILRFTLPDGKKFHMKKDQFISFLWLIGKSEEQRKMIPQLITKVHSKETMFGVKATKDIHKGEMINFSAKVDFECPYYKQEVIGIGGDKKS